MQGLLVNIALIKTLFLGDTPQPGRVYPGQQMQGAVSTAGCVLIGPKGVRIFSLW